MGNRIGRLLQAQATTDQRPAVSAPRTSSRSPAAGMQALNPRVKTQLEETTQAVQAHGLAYPGDEASEERKDAWAAQLRAPRLALTQALSAAAHRDPLPPLPANIQQARLLRAMALIMDRSGTMASPDETDAQTPEAKLLHSLISVGDLHHRWTRHNGLPAESLPPLRHEKSRLMGSASPSDVGAGTRLVSRSGSDVYSNTIAHESVHMAQFNRPRDEFTSSFEFHSPRVDTSLHPRAGFLEAARSVPMKSSLDHPSESQHEAYNSRADEAQAYLEESMGLDIAPRLLDGRYVESTHADLPLHRLTQLLLNAAKPLHRITDDGSTSFNPAKHPGVAADVERILFSVADLETASRSKAWTPAIKRDLENRLGGLQKQFAWAQPQLDGAQQVRAIQAALQTFTSKLKADHGNLLHSPAEMFVSRENVEQAKRLPVSRLALRLSASAASSQRPALSALQLRQAFTKAVETADFVGHVRSLQVQHADGKSPAPEAVGEVVMRLSSALLGVRFEALPSGLTPAVNLYDAPSRTLPVFEGLNDVAGRKRKAQFEATTWQLHVPRHLFDEPQQLGPRLARLAADVAYASAVLRRNPDEIDERRHAALPLGMTTLTNNADAVNDLWKQAEVQRGMALRGSSGVAGKALCQLVDSLPPMDMGTAWHHGPRAMIKQHQQSGDAVSSEAFQANALKRWALPAVAWRRAVADSVT